MEVTQRGFTSALKILACFQNLSFRNTKLFNIKLFNMS